MNSSWTTPWLSKKQISMDLIFDLLILAFFRRGELLMCHSELCHLVTGSYSKIQDSAPVMTCLKKFRHFRCVQEGPGTHSLGFPSVRWWWFLEPAWHKFSACLVSRSKCCGQFGDSNSTYYRSFWLSNINQTSQKPSLGHIFVHFWRARSSRMRFIFHNLTSIQKCFMPPKKLWPWYSILSISPF